MDHSGLHSATATPQIVSLQLRTASHRVSDQAAPAEQLQRRDHSLCENLGGWSFTSLSVMLTVVDPERPPTEPAMSLAWTTTV